MEKYMKQFENCRQWEKPFCTSTCPFHMDVLDFQEKIGRNSYNAAYRTFRNGVGFPDIVAELCPEYCRAVCPRAEIDRSVQLNLLEKTCVAKATKKDPTDYNVPVKNRKIGVIGGGISGLACALRLASKKYQVTVYEKTGRLGGQLWERMPPEIFLEDIKRQFKFENYTLYLDTGIKTIDQIRNQEFEAVYIATGKEGEDFGVMAQGDEHCLLDGEMALFAGGSLTGKNPMEALAEGLEMARRIEDYLKTNRLENKTEDRATKVVADLKKLRKTDGVIPTDKGIFTDEEVVEEVGRCIRCQCDACKVYCDVSAFNNKWPLNIREEVTETVSSSESLLHKTPAVRLVNTCTSCKLCEEVCPESIQIGEMLMDAKRMLHKSNKMPGAYHQFWLKDMEFSNSKFAALTKKAPNQKNCSYAFFPGCHLGAANPAYVLEPYQWLLSKNPETGMLLSCCGIPADWAGNEALHEHQISNLRNNWKSLGKPVLIMACPSCDKHIKEYLPEINTVSLYEKFDQWGFETKEKQEEKRQVHSVFDPCSARNLKQVQQAVRNLVRQEGIEVEEFPNGDKHGCCGFGGHVSIASPEFAEYVVKERSALSENPYITYCINCRDIFISDGKPAFHILQLLFEIEPGAFKLPDVTERRNNRVELKEKLLKEIWGETMTEKPEKCNYQLSITPQVKEKMNRMRIMEEDICNVLEFSAASKRRTFNPQKDTYTSYRELGYITTWLEYKLKGEQIEIVNVYTHRMKIELEGVWNGRKTDTDLR